MKQYQNPYPIKECQRQDQHLVAAAYQLLDIP
jgi:hypothetical protein